MENPHTDIVREYDFSASAQDRWTKQSRNSRDFTKKITLTPEENEFITICK